MANDRTTGHRGAEAGQGTLWKMMGSRMKAPGLQKRKRPLRFTSASQPVTRRLSHPKLRRELGEGQ